MNNPIAYRIGQYHYADPSYLARRTVAGAEYIIGIASAYNAYGLIGSECNGVFVLDETNTSVVLDEAEKSLSGWYGPTAAQLNLFNQLKVWPAAEFTSFITTHERSRIREDAL